MSTARTWVRWLLLGRRDGLRAALRRRLGFFTWVDRTRDRGGDSPAPAPATPAPAPAPAPVAGWVDLCAADDLAPGEATEILVGERPVALVCVAEGKGCRYHALDGVCAHAGGPLGEGSVDGEQLTCPWHGWSYDLRTGRSIVDASVAVDTWEVKVEAGRVLVRLPPAGSGGSAGAA